MIAYFGNTFEYISTDRKYEGELQELMDACEQHEAAIIFDVDQPLNQGEPVPYAKTRATWIEGRGWKDFEGGLNLSPMESWLGLGQILWG